MSVDEAWRDDFATAVDYFAICVGPQVFSDFADHRSFYQKVGVAEDMYLVICSRLKDRAVFQEDGLSHISHISQKYENHQLSGVATFVRDCGVFSAICFASKNAGARNKHAPGGS